MKPVKYSDVPAPATGKVQEVGAFEAKTHLASILDRVGQGESFMITKRGVPIAELRPLAKEGAAPVKRTAGFWKKKTRMAPDFDAPLPEFEEFT